MSPPDLGPRYSPLRQLGTGGEASVWLVADALVAGRHLAAKLLRGEADLSSLRREFALLSRLRHPGLAAVYDLGRSAGGTAFLIRDYVEGRPLLEACCGIAEGLEALAQLLGILDFLHRRGVVHRDLKPDNVLVGPAGVFLLDLGLAAVTGQDTEVSGTAGYIAPEVLAGEAPSARSDLYAVGVLLHQVLWGRLPFAGSAAAITAAQLAAEPELPAEPARLREICQQLLRREPERRPGSAAELLGSLEEVLGTPGSSARFLAGRGLPEPALVGREAVIDAARLLLAGGEHQHRGLLLVGARGSGRSRLCEEIATLAQLRGLRVQRELPSSSAEPRQPPAGSAEAALAVRRVVDEARRQAGQPTLLVLDDVEEPGQAQALLALARLDQPDLLLCVACLPGEVERLLAPELRRIPLGSLEESEVEELVASMLPAGWPHRELAAAVHRLCGGSPALAAELTRQAVSRQLAGLPPLPPDQEVPEAGQRRLQARLERLSLRAGELARVAALFENGAPASLLQEITGGELGAALTELLREGAVIDERGRLAVAGRSLAQALLGTLPAGERAALGRRALERLAARGSPATERALVAMHAGLAEEQWRLLAEGARQARARLELGCSVRLYEAALAGATDAFERGRLLGELAALELGLGQNAAAVRHLSQALAEAPAAERAARLAALVDAQLRAGQTGEALASLEPRLNELLPAERRSLLALRAKVLLFAGRVEEAAAQARELRPLPEEDELCAEVMHTLGLCAYYRGQTEEALAALERGLAAARRLEDRLMEARLINALALVHQRRAEFEPARLLYQECLRLARELKHLPFEATFLQNLASVAQQQGEHAAALRHYEQSLEVARGFGGGRETAQVLHNLGRLQASLGQEGSALALLRRSAGLARSLGWTSLLAQNLLAEGELHLEAGRLGEARPQIEKAESLFLELGEAAPRAEAALALARWQLRAGDPEAARARAETVLSGSEGMDSVKLQAELVLGAALLEVGAPAAALPHLSAALRLAEKCGEQAPLVEIHHQLARARSAAGDEAAADEHRQAARTRLQRLAEALPPELRRAFLRLPLNAQVLGGSERRVSRPGVVTGALDADLLRALLQINKELNAEPDLKRLLERIIDHAVELAGAERGFLLMKREGQFSIEVARNIDQETVRRKEFKISRSVAEEVLSSGQPLLTVDAVADERFRDFLSVHDLRLRSVLCVPMTIRRQVRGVIYLDNRFRRQAFGPAEAELLAALAEQAGLAVGNWELLEENRRRQQELEQSREELRRVNAELQRAMLEQTERVQELAQLARSQQGELEGRYRFENLVGQSAAMRELFRLMDRLRSSDAPVLIHGESGTGKELVAKALHYAGPRRGQAFVSVNCGALSPTLLESELFGYERGAFTGAERQHRGLFERAHLGTLFLDEVGDMPADLQVKLLRVLQEKRFERLGGEREIGSDFRLVAASNKDLAKLASAGQFRQDLYFRINVVTLRLPPLRERREDIPLLVEHLLKRHAAGREVRISPAAMRLLMGHDWPGNVRELENQLLRALALAGPVIGPEDLALQPSPRSGVELADTEGLTLAAALKRLERQLALQALRECRGSVTEAARRLGMTRVGLHKLLKRHGVHRHGAVS